MMPNIQIGCAGFSYDDWVGSFYPPYVDKRDFLSHYAKYFSVVEINSTHYMIPKSSIVKKWANSVPGNFKFCIKIWNQVTHIKDYGLGVQNLQLFLEALQPIRDKVAYYLFQFPPFFKYSEDHQKYLQLLLRTIGSGVKVAVELRDNSWFESSILKSFLDGTNHILGTVYLNDVLPFYPDWQKNFYIRVIGDRSLTRFNEVQRDMPEIWTQLTEILTKYKEATDIVDIFVIFNNHYSGFSPADSNRLKLNLGLPFKDYTKRKSVTDYF
jgi:uncharacterized protein YecE (DUF72 family)